MAVVPERQRQGIASFLLRASEERARARDPDREIYLTARKKDEPAVQLYMCALSYPWWTHDGWLPFDIFLR